MIVSFSIFHCSIRFKDKNVQEINMAVMTFMSLLSIKKLENFKPNLFYSLEPLRLVKIIEWTGTD